MSDPTTRAQAGSTEEISDAVLEYLTSIKQLVKRNGAVQDFDVQKLRLSIAKALGASGMKPDLADKVTGYVMTRLVKRFDGHTTPTYSDIRDVVNVTFIDFNFTHTAKQYLGYKVSRAMHGKEATYGNGITVERYFTRQGVHPYDLIEWEKRDARITNEKGQVVFEQKGVEVPKWWTQTATNVVVSKYFRGKIGETDREYSVRQLVGRVATTIAGWGRNDGYFQTKEDADAYESELTHILVNQMAAFNSPVWFNVGVNAHPQCSACFINSVQDDMRSILQLATTEGMLFKGGSGAGSNLSSLRSRQEYLGGSNGRASGPVSFMKGFDAFAGVIKSGGKTRRAAKMVILNIDHPDIEEFITCKAEEEKKAWALIDAGYDGSMDGPAYGSIYFQNA
ncbi:MAG: Ribonucleoside-diphosphate reductase, adenosylcobalamin-dependent, partial [Candidatus Uhrbacteria bacterium GW2011_GWA2_53_10]